MEEKYFSSMEEQTQILENRFVTSLNQNQIHIDRPVMVYLVLPFNIRNLHNIIFQVLLSSRIRNLQSIGRGLRLSDKKKVTLYDIQMIYNIKKRKNYTGIILRKE